MALLNRLKQGRNPLLLAGVGLAALVLAGVLFAIAPGGGPTPENLAAAGEAAAKPLPTEPDVFHETLLPMVRQHCVDCHSTEDPQAGIDLTIYPDEASLFQGEHRRAWERVHSMLEIGAMPPPDMNQPSDADRMKVVAWLDKRLYHFDCDLVDDPGRVTIRRLNRAEYNNTVRDLLGVDFRPADDFPSDDVGYGFDNIGDVLSLSPLLMEKYLDAAETITAQAIPVISAEDLVTVLSPSQLKSRPEVDLRGRFLTLSSRATVIGQYAAPVDGQYELNIAAMANQHGNEPARMEVKVDGRVIGVIDVIDERKERDYVRQVQFTAGDHTIEASFVNDFYEAGKGDRNLYIGRFQITAPQSALPEQEFITATPDDTGSVAAAADRVLRPFLTRAFRRPATDDEVQRFASVVQMAVDEGESYAQGIQFAVQAVLVSPSFLFRIESDAAPDDPQADHIVTDYELASRLSYFLWSSMPDAELFDLAGRGELHRPEILDQQVRRMLADPRSESLTANFAEQWLSLRSLDEHSPDPERFPDFDEELRQAMKQESLLLFREIILQDLSVLDFLDAGFTFMNERLARHYGVSGVRGEQFQKVALHPQQRAGVLTHASILMLTSNPDRTSPVKRGKWIMENILGKEPPPPPAGVPELEVTAKAAPDATLREQLLQHRADPGCASCHTTMDTIGFGFENFDAVGRWRDMDGQHPVDASGTLPSGDSFQTPTELVRILKKRGPEFARVLTRRLLTYGLGRGLEYYDRCAVDEILERLNANDYRFSELVLGIVHSRPFQQRRGDGERP